VRVVIADDSALWREGLARLLIEAGIGVDALVGDAPSLQDAVAQYQPDVALIDIRMPPTWTHEGTDAAERLQAHWPNIGRLLLSQTLESRHALALARTQTRGFGYLLKDHVLDVATLVDAISSVSKGGTVLDPDVVTALLSRRDTQDRISALTSREQQILSLVAQGRSNGAIGRDLFLTTKTIESHIASILTKLELAQEPDNHRRVLAVLAWLQTS
jgi:DNA-binding NarL/FixJ family response regulator